MRKGIKRGFDPQIFKKAVQVCIDPNPNAVVPVQIFDAIVQAGSQDEDTMTCVVDSVDSNLNNLTVRYNLCISDGEINVPEDESTVTIAKTSFTDPYIVRNSDLKSKLIAIGNQTWNNDGNKQIFNDGKYGGIPRIVNPDDSNSSLLKKINNLENLVNDLTSKFNTHTHILTLTSGTGTAAPTANPETTVLTPTVQKDIENPNITHGDKF